MRVCYERSKFFVDPNLSNIINAINELRIKNGQDAVAIVTPQEAAATRMRLFECTINNNNSF
jgi:hypothetical protein